MRRIIYGAALGLALTVGSGAAYAAPTYEYDVIGLGDLPGGSVFSVGYGINAAGQVSGTGNAATGARAFLWDPATGMQDLGDLPGGADFSEGFDINDAGQVVGASVANGGFSAFLWDDTNGMRDLNDLIDPMSGWLLSNAYGINGTGQITGFGVGPNGLGEAFLLTPTSTDLVAVPLPATAWLFLSALGGLAGVRWAGARRASASAA
jgi:probable HAF family extracellular repeat protein